jgi:HK97 family phage prohead protease
MKRPTLDGVLTKQDAPIDLVKADGAKGEVEGYATKWWKVDSYGEFTIPGSFTKTIAERGPKADHNRIHFRYEHMVTVGKHLELDEDSTGVPLVAFISDDGADGTRLRRHLSDGLQYGISIGYRTLRTRPGTTEDPLDWSTAPNWMRDDNGEFDPARALGLSEIKLLENSAVSFPAVDNALVTGYRNEGGIATLEQILKDVKRGHLTEETRPLLEQLAQHLPAALASSTTGASPQPADSESLYLMLEIESFLVNTGVIQS